MSLDEAVQGVEPETLGVRAAVLAGQEGERGAEEERLSGTMLSLGELICSRTGDSPASSTALILATPMPLNIAVTSRGLCLCIQN